MVIEALSQKLGVSPYELAGLVGEVVKELCGHIDDTPDTRRVIEVCLTMAKLATNDNRVFRLHTTLPYTQSLSESDNLIVGISAKIIKRWAHILQGTDLSAITRLGPNFYDAKGNKLCLDGPTGDTMLEGHSFILNLLSDIELTALSKSPGGTA